MKTDLTLLSSTACFGGKQQRYQHYSNSNRCNMTFSIFLPEKARTKKLPVVFWLSGLTCTDENFVQKAGAQRAAAELDLIIVAPDTSPRGDDVPDDPEGHWDFGLGAGFYVNATETPWSEHYHMFDYVTEELRQLVDNEFPSNGERAICGHSMGGHGAFVSALHFPEYYRSVSAFAPICAPSHCPWGDKALSNYLGQDKRTWQKYDTCALLESKGLTLPALVDQGLNDSFLSNQLNIDLLKSTAQKVQTDIQIEQHEGYDHSYFFIATFIEKHLAFHKEHLA